MAAIDVLHPGSVDAFLNTLDPRRAELRKSKEAIPTVQSSFYAPNIEFFSQDPIDDIQSMELFLRETRMGHLHPGFQIDPRPVKKFRPHTPSQEVSKLPHPYLYVKNTEVEGLSIVGVHPPSPHKGTLRNLLSEELQRYPIVSDVGVTFGLEQDEIEAFLHAYGTTLEEAKANKEHWTFAPQANPDIQLVFYFPVKSSDGRVQVEAQAHPNRLSNSPAYQNEVIQQAARVVNQPSLPLQVVSELSNGDDYENSNLILDFTPDYEY